MACSLIALGMGYFGTSNHILAEWGLATVALASGAFLLTGLMTPVVALLVAAGGMGVALSWIPLPHQDLLDSYLAIINLIVTSIAIVLLGPGAFSLDARMFGRREINIPANTTEH